MCAYKKQGAKRQRTTDDVEMVPVNLTTGYIPGRSFNQLAMENPSAFGRALSAQKRPDRGNYRFQGGRSYGVQQMKNIGGELKYHDVDMEIFGLATADGSPDDNPPTQGGGWTLAKKSLIEIPNGNGATQRIGQKIRIVGLYCKGMYLLNTGTQPSGTQIRVRCIVFIDKANNKSTSGPARDDILKTDDIDSFYNMERIQRFKILYDKTVALNQITSAYDGTTGSAFGSNVKNFKISLKTNEIINYDGTTGDQSELTNSNIGVAFVNTRPSNSQVIYAKMNWRLRFSDN